MWFKKANNSTKKCVNDVKKSASSTVFADKTQSRLDKLFLHTPIIKAVIIISIPSMLMAFMSALYTFSDQLMMAKIIPIFQPLEHLSAFTHGFSYHDYIFKVKELNAQGLNITLYSSNLVVRTAVANIAPITIFLTASTLLIGNGTSINFSRANGKKDKLRAQQVWANGFYSNLIWGLLITVLLLASAKTIISLENGNPISQLESIKDQLTNADYKNLKEVYNDSNNLILTYSEHFAYIAISGLVFNMFDLFFSILIITEGKQKMVVFAALMSNILNIFLDFIFIYFGRMAMIGGAIATVIGWSFNCAWYVLQIWIMNKKGETNILFSALKWKKHEIDWKLIQNIFFNGLASFLRNISMGIAVWWQLFMLSTFVFANIQTSGAAASSFTNFYGAANPIYSLFFPVILGTIQGSRIMCSYLYGAKNFKRFRTTYWVAMSIGFIYGFSIAMIIGFWLNPYFLTLFNINDQPTAQLILIIMLMQLPIYAFTVGGQVIFQATSKSFNACICALMQGIFCNIPISLIIAWISIGLNNQYIFLWTPLIVIIFSSIIIFIWTVIYMRKYFSDDILNTKIRYMMDKKWLMPPSHR